MSENKTRILIIDDDSISREMVRSALQNYQYDVDAVDSVQKALELIQDKPYAVIITDKNMPDTQNGENGGMEILRHTKMQMPATEVIMLTGFSSTESAIEAMKNGAFDYIVKPFNPKDLHDKIQRILDYQSFINPKNTISIYRSLHNAILTIMQNQGRLRDEDLHKALKEIDQTIDHFFRAQKEWERILLIQKEALAKIANYAEQMNETYPDDDPRKDLFAKITQEANKRI